MLKGPVKIALLQDVPGTEIRDYFQSVLDQSRPDIIAFPEYFFIEPDENSVIHSAYRKNQILDQLRRWSADFQCAIVGGSLVVKEKHVCYNRTYVLNKGVIVGHYDKIHLYINEGRGRLTAGTDYKVFDVDKRRLGVLICADVLYSESFANIAVMKPDLIIIPTTSPYIFGETAEQKFNRDKKLFENGAAITKSLICKVSACGSLLGRRLQGRSLIAAPGRILWRIQPGDEDKPALIVARLDEISDNPLLDIAVYRP